MLGLFADREDGSDMFLRKVDWFSTDWKALYAEDKTLPHVPIHATHFAHLIILIRNIVGWTVQIMRPQTNRNCLSQNPGIVCVQTLVPWGWRTSCLSCPLIDKTKERAAGHSTWRLLTLCSKAFVLSVPIIHYKGNSFCVPHGGSPLFTKVNVG
jgi:hypothetical protein